jgi:hypothetical protein
VLRTAQWALDGRIKLPSISEFRERLIENAKGMVAGAREFRSAVNRNGAELSAEVLHRSAAGLETDDRLSRLPAPRLVLTSPPYPESTCCTTAGKWMVAKRLPLPSG